MTQEQLADALIGKNQIKRWAMELLLLPPDFWDIGENQAWLQDAERFLDFLACRSAMLAAYLGARGANGGGDAGHDDALQAGQVVESSARKLLGYHK
jgi:hypothetical protein